MKRDQLHFLLFMKSNFHELLLIKEIQSRFADCDVITTQSQTEVLNLLSTVKIDAIIMDVQTNLKNDYYDIQKILFTYPNVPIIAIVDDNSVEVSSQLHKIGITELLQKNETFFVAVPLLLRRIISQKKPIGQFSQKSEDSTNSEHLKLTSRTLSHEINNPLMTILGITELILDSKEDYDADLIKKIEVIEESAYRIQKSTDRLSNLSAPVYQKTPNGAIIDPHKSRISTNSQVKLTETE